MKRWSINRVALIALAAAAAVEQKGPSSAALKAAPLEGRSLPMYEVDRSWPKVPAQWKLGDASMAMLEASPSFHWAGTFGHERSTSYIGKLRPSSGAALSAALDGPFCATAAATASVIRMARLINLRFMVSSRLGLKASYCIRAVEENTSARRGRGYFAVFLAGGCFRLLYTASTNMAVVQGPELAP